MRRIICLSLISLISISPLFSQVILPKFEKAVKVERLSDDAEESNIFTYNNGNNMFFYRTYVKGEGNEMEVIRQNIWFSEKANDKWSRPDRLFRMQENEFENIIIGASMDGRKVYIFKTVYHPTEDSLERVIGVRERSGKDDWSEFQPIEIPGLVLGENYYHFHLSHDEKILMISMSPTDELLDEDIFVSFRQDDGSWSEVKNLGPTINTKRVEISPYIDNDGKTLYFSSEGHGGFGGSDVFVSYRLDDSWTHWTKPKNLGESINTKDYEENFVHTHNNEYYFTSNKDSESADIYYSFSDYAVELNRGKALLMKQDAAMSTNIKVLDDQGKEFDNINIGEDGKFKFKIKENAKDLSFIASESTAEGAFIYTLDEEDNKRERWIIGKDLKSSPESEFATDQKIVGSLQLAGDPFQDVEIAVYDINGYKLGKTRTDENGIFSFETAAIDNTLKFVPNSEEDFKFNAIQLYDANNKFLHHLEPNEGLVSKEERIPEEKLAKNMKPITPPVKTEPKETTTAATTTPKKPASSKDYTNMVYFGFNAISLDREEERKLRSVVRYMKKNPGTTATITGNTDAEGENKLNMDIGKRRAIHVKRVLVRDGIEAGRIAAESNGKSNPIASNETEEGRSQNRRVEISIK